MIYDKKKKKSKRVVGRITRDVVIYGSESQLVRPLTINSLAPFDLYDKKEKEYKKNELNIFKKYTSNNLYKSLWDE
tara:strand:- start:2157 stop:2384 length:228 start_codon:yes stop_codon:yes gene_type:complete